MIIFVPQDLPGSKTLIEKLAQNAKHAADGIFIPLKEDEMDAMKQSHVIGLNPKEGVGGIEFVSLDPSRRHIAVVKRGCSTTIHDLFKLKACGYHIDVIRTD